MDIKKVGKFIASCRKEKNMIQKELAELIGVTDKSISKWERGINLPDSSLIIPLCQCLDIEIQELLLGEYCEKKDLLNESNELIIDLMKDKITDQEAFMTYKFILFFIVILPLFFIVIISLFPYLEGFISFGVIWAPFTLIFGLIKMIEEIIKHKSYFGYFVITSMSLFTIIIYFQTLALL